MLGAVEFANGGGCVEDSIREVNKSYGRAMVNNRTLIERFYELLMAASPELPPIFANTDMDKQNYLLEQGLNMAILYPQENAIAKHALKRLRKLHNRDNLNIAPELYQYWIDSLVAAIEEADPEFDSRTAVHWRTVLAPAVEFIKEGY